jgi:hypothetical protein
MEWQGEDEQQNAATGESAGSIDRPRVGGGCH